MCAQLHPDRFACASCVWLHASDMQLWCLTCKCGLSFSCTTGITATLICFPLDVLRTRLMAPWGHKYGGPLTTLKCMVKYEGPGALYAGED
jgi:hypothetical protein